jgi:hypothetical protein
LYYFNVPPIPQDPAYHRFADGRRFLGIANGLNVLSNISFLLVGIAGCCVVLVSGRRFTLGAARLVWPALFSAGNSYPRGPVNPRGRWLVGSRVGMGVDTPVGPIRIDYGRASEHRGTVFARVGTWF